MKTGYFIELEDPHGPENPFGLLQEAGCDRIVEDRTVVEGGKLVRKRLEQTLVDLGAGDLLVITSLAALGESMPYVIKSVHSLVERGAGFVSLADGIDTTKDGGAFYRFVETLSRFEKVARARRTRRGMRAASRYGRKLGRPRKLTEWQEIEVRRAYRRGEETVGSLADKYGVSTMTIYKTLDETGERA